MQTADGKAYTTQFFDKPFMEKYESKQQRILKPASMVYSVVSDFSNFTPILQDKVDDWQADADTCSFKVKGITARLRIVERIENELIKIEGEDGSPVDFTFWMQLKEVDERDTRMRIVLHAHLNMMMKMMIGGKLQQAVDQIAEQVATTFNSMPY